MSLSFILPSSLKRAGLCAALVLLAGCATTPRQAVVEVTSPPVPSTGSQRIMAYDAYAAALFAPVNARPAAVTASGDTVAPASEDKRSVESTLD